MGHTITRGGAVAATVVSVVGVLLAGCERSSGPESSSGEGDGGDTATSFANFDVTRVVIEEPPSIRPQVAAIDDELWLSTDGPLLLQVDSATGAVEQRVELPYDDPSDLVVDDSHVWTLHLLTEDRRFIVGVNRSNGQVDRGPFPLTEEYPEGLVSEGDALWLLNGKKRDLALRRVDKQTGEVTLVDGVGNHDLALGDGLLWATADGALAQVDPATSERQAKVPIAVDADYLTYADGEIVTLNFAGVGERVDPASGQSLVTTQVLPSPAVADDIVSGPLGIWAIMANRQGDEKVDVVVRLDPETLEPDATFEVGAADIAVTAEGVYVTATEGDFDDTYVLYIATPRS